MTLATTDDEGPWAAGIAFTVIGLRELYFISQRSSRHGRAIAANGLAAGAIFNSTVAPDDVESVQFSAVCRDVGDDAEQIRRVLELSGTCAGEPASEEEVRRIENDPEKGVFILQIQDMYVLDQVAWAESQIDAREQVDPGLVFAGIWRENGE
ncbi:hypothetical protein A6A25_25555 [Saccharothrix sp. CB00851]|nr:hypothetical protein A6A25_25555 [Saccharothrix sp. CB00851]